MTHSDMIGKTLDMRVMTDSDVTEFMMECLRASWLTEFSEHRSLLTIFGSKHAKQLRYELTEELRRIERLAGYLLGNSRYDRSVVGAVLAPQIQAAELVRDTLTPSCGDWQEITLLIGRLAAHRHRCAP